VVHTGVLLEDVAYYFGVPKFGIHPPFWASHSDSHVVTDGFILYPKMITPIFVNRTDRGVAVLKFVTGFVVQEIKLSNGEELSLETVANIGFLGVYI